MLKSVYFIRCVGNAFIAFVRINRCFCLHKHYVQFIEYWGPKRPGSGGGQPPSAGPGLQHAFDQFSAACNQAGTKISSKRIEALCLLRRPRQCILQVSGNILQQVEMFKYLEVVFTSEIGRAHV